MATMQDPNQKVVRQLEAQVVVDSHVLTQIESYLVWTAKLLVHSIVIDEEGFLTVRLDNISKPSILKILVQVEQTVADAVQQENYVELVDFRFISHRQPGMKVHEFSNSLHIRFAVWRRQVNLKF